MSQFRLKRSLIAHVFSCAFKLAWTSLFIPTLGWSFEPTLPTATIPDISAYVDQSNTDTFIQTIGFGMDHRPYEPATPMGPSFDIGIEATLVGPPNNLGRAINNIGSAASSDSASSPSTSSPIPFIPSAKVHLRRGFDENFDTGFSALYIPTSIPLVGGLVGGTFLLGGDIKYTYFYPEEGITWAFRTSYNFVNLAVANSGYLLSIKTFTLSPQIIASKKMGFAEPYMGAGYQYTYGTILATVPPPPIELLPGVAVAPVSLSVDGSGSGVFFFGGLSLVSIIRFRITIEGAFNPAGENYIGTKIGFTL